VRGWVKLSTHRHEPFGEIRGSVDTVLDEHNKTCATRRQGQETKSQAPELSVYGLFRLERKGTRTVCIACTHPCRSYACRRKFKYSQVLSSSKLRLNQPHSDSLLRSTTEKSTLVTFRRLLILRSLGDNGRYSDHRSRAMLDQDDGGRARENQCGDL
jgi:hypothetical protein